MPLYNLIEYSSNYSKTSGSLRQYCEDTLDVNHDGNIVDFNETNTIDSFNFKIKVAGQTDDDDGERDNIEIMIP